MGEVSQGNWRVLAATLLSAALIVGAYVFARGVGAPSPAEASTEAEILKVIATKDSDGDGLPDWAEALYGTSSSAVDTFNLGMPDGEAVAKGLVVPKAMSDITVATSSSSSASIVADIDPSLPPPPEEGTLTAMFAQNFFTLFVKAVADNGGEDLSEEQMNDVANQTLNSLSSLVAAAPPFKSLKDLTIASSGPDALKAFAAEAEAVLTKHTLDVKKTELFYLWDVVQKNDTAALAPLASLAKGYRESAVGLSVLTVPSELADAHLALVNTLMRLSQVTVDFARVNTDVLATILALHQYPQVVLVLNDVFVRVGETYATAGLSLSTGTPGAVFVNLAADAQKRFDALMKQAAARP